MARKKRPSDKNKRKPPKPPDKLPDRRAMEGIMHQMIAGLQGPPRPETPLDKAQQCIYKAFEEPDERKRLQLAKEALALSPDCADAYVLLAEHAASRKEALRLYEQGVAAGERALGPEAFERDAGHFWAILETRPYMRARIGLVHTLWTSGRREEAVRHLQDMLRLNPNDNQGVRYTLAGFLLFLDRDEDLAHLLQQYEEASATWLYTKALLAFRQQGDTPEARRLLKAATKGNKHVPAYLLGEKYPPAQQPEFYGHGDENEALIYIGGFLAAWKSTPGAIAWLRKNAKPRKPKKAPPARGPLGIVKKWLNKNLEQAADVWLADFRQLPSWVQVAGEMVRLWIVLVTSPSNDLVLAHELSEEEPLAAVLWDALAQAMQQPAAGTPHRPTELHVRTEERWESLKPHLEEIGVQVVLHDRLEEIDPVFQDLTEHLFGKPRPGLLEMPGVTPAQVASFYEAAAAFFRAAPWKKVGYEAAIRVECAKYQSGPWYAVLMGQMGLTTGLAIYDDLKVVQRLWAEGQSDEDNARESVAATVLFGEEWDVPVADLEAAKQHGWPVARPDAYPEVFHKDRGLSVRPPVAWELELVEGCLRAVPEFVARHQQDDPAREEMTVAVASGPLQLVLSWVVDEVGA